MASRDEAGRIGTAEERVRSLPFWQGPVTLTPLKGGVSNASFRVTDSSGSYVARVGADFPFHHVSRAREAVISRAAFEAGLSPELVFAGDGVMVLRHIAARTYGEADVRTNAAACVELLRRCHRGLGKRVLGPPAFFWVFQILRDYAETLRQGRHRHVPDIPCWMAIVDEMEEAQMALPIVFGHHDVLPTNIMDDGTRLWLIDWEYGAFGTAMFDLASLSANNSFDTAGDRLILETYFGREPTEEMWRSFHAMKVASALRESVWAMVSELHLDVPGVDYVAYAAEYLGRFEMVLAAYRDAYGA